MEVELVCPRRWFQELLTEGLKPEAERRTFAAPLGTAVSGRRLRLLVREPPRSARTPTSGPELRVSFRSGRPAGATLTPGGPWSTHLVLGRGPAEGRWEAWTQPPDDPASAVPVSRILLPGPAMLQLEADAEPATVRPPGGLERWSRTRGALGDAAWRRLVGLRVGLVGCGRLGSTIARALAANGVRSLVLVDPDEVEQHNLGEGDGWVAADLGQSKAEALAERLTATYPWTQAEPVSAPVEAWVALDALKLCDVLVCVPDTVAARETTGLLAALYHIPLIEAGTGVFSAEPGGRRMGLEVRLVLPGEVCRPCMDGSRRPAEQARLPWWATRLGSLRSLNMVAAGMALLFLEGLLREELREPVQLHCVWGGASPWVSSRWRCSEWRGCLRRVTGTGDAGVSASGVTDTDVQTSRLTG